MEVDRQAVILGVALLLAAACEQRAAPDAARPADARPLDKAGPDLVAADARLDQRPPGAFGSPQRVTIRGYDADAMEPFISKDGRYLLFNGSNHPSVDTNLHYAERVDDVTFDYKGEIEGANSTALDGVPSLDESGLMYFVSTRSYAQTLSSIYRGRFDAGQVTAVELVEGVSQKIMGVLSFDAEITADGKSLCLVDGEFDGGTVPKSADLVLAQADGTRFARATAQPFAKVNTADLEYAPAISADGLELFFTRIVFVGSTPSASILRATRAATSEAFTVPEPVPPISGFVEGPTLTADGRSLYYHKLEGSRFVLYRVAR